MPGEAPGASGARRRGEVWVWVELQSGQAAEVSLELLGRARELADRLGVAVGAVLLGSGAKASRRRSSPRRRHRLRRRPRGPRRLPGAAVRARGRRLVRRPRAADRPLRRHHHRPRPGAARGQRAAHRPHRRLHRPAHRRAHRARRDATSDCCSRSGRPSAATSSPPSSAPSTGRRWPPCARASCACRSPTRVAAARSSRCRSQPAGDATAAARARPARRRRPAGPIVLDRRRLRRRASCAACRRRSASTSRARASSSPAAPASARATAAPSSTSWRETLGGVVGASRAAVDARLGRPRAPGRPDRHHGAAQALHRLRHLAAPSSTAPAWTSRRASWPSTPTPLAPIFSIAHYGIVGDLHEVIPRLMHAYRSKA